MIADERRKRRHHGVSISLVVLFAFGAFSAACIPVPSPDAVSPLVSSTVKDSLDLVIVHSNDTWGYLAPCG